RYGMITIGVVLICIGALSACGGAMMPMTVMMGNLGAGQNGPPVPHQTQMIIGLTLLYLTLAGGMIFVAIGTLRCQRWARPVVIVVSAGCLITGIAAMIAFGLGYSDFAN